MSVIPALAGVIAVAIIVFSVDKVVFSVGSIVDVPSVPAIVGVPASALGVLLLESLLLLLPAVAGIPALLASPLLLVSVQSIASQKFNFQAHVIG